jgi:hypothetical protein
VEPAVGRRAGTRHRSHQSRQHRAVRRRQARRLTRRAQHDRRRRRPATADRARQHALRTCRRRRVRHLLHRLLRHPHRDRTDAASHVPRRRARTHRPRAGLLDRRHRHAVLRPARRFPRRPSARAPNPDPAEAAAVADGSLGIGSLRRSSAP